MRRFFFKGSFSPSYGSALVSTHQRGRVFYLLPRTVVWVIRYCRDEGHVQSRRPSFGYLLWSVVLLLERVTGYLGP